MVFLKTTWLYTNIEGVWDGDGGGAYLKTRRDTRPTVADGWALPLGRGRNARFHTFQLDHYGPTDRRTDGRTDGWTESLS